MRVPRNNAVCGTSLWHIGKAGGYLRFFAEVRRNHLGEAWQAFVSREEPTLLEQKDPTLGLGSG